MSYFDDALSDFAKDFAYGGAIRHLLDSGYSVERIIRDYHYPVSREYIEKVERRFREEKEKGKDHSA